MSLVKILHGGLDIILKPIYPPFCLLCDENTIKFPSLVCSDCINNIPSFEPPLCSICGLPLEGNEFCLHCEKQTEIFSRISSYGPYNSSLGELIRLFKFNSRTFLLNVLGECIYKSFKRDLEGMEHDAIIPVPLHLFRYLSRGFNQSALLSKYLSERSGIPVAENWLLRIKNTRQQSLLNAEERKHNLKNAFKIKKKRTDLKKVILVDDVYTTGSTARACSEELYKEEVEEITILTVARTYRDTSA
ncbi:MAG: ComF family protein [Candidatus Coatesbacteria bacterium]|nr:ComF family protein [Candidatus Coatesbacteria bacterium]